MNGTGYPIETSALSVFNMLSHARRPMSLRAVRDALARPDRWDPRVTLEEVSDAAAWLAARGWVQLDGDIADLTDRHPVTRLGRDVVRDPTDREGKALLMLGAYQ